jgi:Flp pilus assembly protein TadG
MVEFALVLPLLVGLFLGAVFLGQDIHVYNRLEESVRAGARFASTATYDAYSGADPAPTKCAACSFTPTSGPFVTTVKNIVAYGCDPAGGSATGCTDLTVVEGVRPANINVSLNIVNWVPVSISVSVSGVQMVTPNGRMALNGKPVTVFPFVGVFMAPPPS